MKIIPDSKRCSYLSCLWDAGADISLITFSKARQLKVNLLNSTLLLQADKNSILDSREYKLILRGKFHATHIMKVYGIAKITNNIAAIDMKSIVAQFKNVNLGDIERPSGEVNLLIGYDYAGWHPTSEQVHEHLIILSNIFGKCVGGRCPSLEEMTRKSILIPSSVHFVQSGSTPDEFMTIESLGVNCTPKCGNCKCGSCPIGGKTYSIKAERELKAPIG